MASRDIPFFSPLLQPPPPMACREMESCVHLHRMWLF